MDERRRLYDPRWRRQEVLLAVLAEGGDDEKRAALRELALIGDMDAALAIREYALGGDAYLDRAYQTAYRLIQLRESGVEATSDDEWEWDGRWLEGNFVDTEIDVPPVPGPGAEETTRIQAAALTLLARGEVADKLPALATLARLGDEQAALAVCRELMNPDPQVQYQARFAYRQIMMRLANGESAAGDHHQQLLHKFGKMVQRDIEGAPPLPPAPQRLPEVVAVVANALRRDDREVEAPSAPAAAEVTEPAPEPIPFVSQAETDAAEVPPPSQAAAGEAATAVPVDLPLAAPTTTAEEAALLPDADDLGLLPQ